MKQLTIKQDKFVNAYVNLGNGTEAVKQAGYKVANTEVASTIASENIRKPLVKKAIAKKRADIASVLEGESMSLLTDLLTIAKSDTTPIAVKTKVLQDLLDRAGYTAKKEVSISGGDTAIQIETRHTSELAKRARELMVLTGNS